VAQDPGGSFGGSCGVDANVAVISGDTTGTRELSDRSAMEAWLECAWDDRGGDWIAARVMGDVDGDGRKDLGLLRTQEWYVVPGTTKGEIDPYAQAIFGVDLTDVLSLTNKIGDAGDVDGDGLAESYALTHGPFTEGDFFRDGGLQIVRGGRSGTFGVDGVDAMWVGQAGDTYMGMMVAGGGDADGDGVPDLLVAAGDDSDFQEHGGHLYLLSGATLLSAP